MEIVDRFELLPDTSVRFHDPIDGIAANPMFDRFAIAQRYKRDARRGNFCTSALTFVNLQDEYFTVKGTLLHKIPRLSHTTQSSVSWSRLADQNIAMTTGTGFVLLWDLNSCKSQTMPCSRTATVVKFHPKYGKELGLCSRDGKIELHDLRVVPREHRTIHCPQMNLRDFDFGCCPGNRTMLAVVGENGGVRIYDYRQPSMVYQEWISHNGPAFAVAFNPVQDSIIATGGRDKCIRVWDWKSTPGPSAQKLHVIDTSFAVGRMAWTNDCKWDICSVPAFTPNTALADYVIKIWDAQQPYLPLMQFRPHKSTVTDISFPDRAFNFGRRFVSSDDTGRLVYNTYNRAYHPMDNLSFFAMSTSTTHDEILLTFPVELKSENGVKKYGSEMHILKLLNVVNSAEDMRFLAKYYHVLSRKREPASELCLYNANVAKHIGRTDLALTWNNLVLLLEDNTISAARPTMGESQRRVVRKRVSKMVKRFLRVPKDLKTVERRKVKPRKVAQQTGREDNPELKKERRLLGSLVKYSALVDDDEIKDLDYLSHEVTHEFSMDTLCFDMDEELFVDNTFIHPSQIPEQFTRKPLMPNRKKEVTHRRHWYETPGAPREYEEIHVVKPKIKRVSSFYSFIARSLTFHNSPGGKIIRSCMGYIIDNANNSQHYSPARLCIRSPLTVMKLVFIARYRHMCQTILDRRHRLQLSQVPLAERIKKRIRRRKERLTELNKQWIEQNELTGITREPRNAIQRAIATRSDTFLTNDNWKSLQDAKLAIAKICDTQPFYFRLPSNRSKGIKLLIDYHAAMDDVQTVACICMVVGERITSIVPERMVDRWFFYYTDLLDSFEMYVESTAFMKASYRILISRLNAEDNFFNNLCPKCDGQLFDEKCRQCGRENELCIICERRVQKSIHMCTVCGHGGHPEHMVAWFQDQDTCPDPACDHVCYYNPWVEHNLGARQDNGRTHRAFLEYNFWRTRLG